METTLPWMISFFNRFVRQPQPEVLQEEEVEEDLLQEVLHILIL